MVGGCGGQTARSRSGGVGGRHLDAGGAAVACHQPAARVQGGRHLLVVGGGGGQSNAAFARAHLFKILIVHEYFENTHR